MKIKIMKTYKVDVYDDGAKHWFLNGKLHREDGPAVETSNSTKYWYQNNKLHREDGPAVEYPDGTKFWYQNGKQHREDGPAMEYPDGTKHWYLNRVCYPEAEWKKRVNSSCEGKVVTIEGKKYKLTKI